MTVVDFEVAAAVVAGFASVAIAQSVVAAVSSLLVGSVAVVAAPVANNKAVADNTAIYEEGILVHFEDIHTVHCLVKRIDILA